MTDIIFCNYFAAREIYLRSLCGQCHWRPGAAVLYRQSIIANFDCNLMDNVNPVDSQVECWDDSQWTKMACCTCKCILRSNHLEDMLGRTSSKLIFINSNKDNVVWVNVLGGNTPGEELFVALLVRQIKPMSSSPLAQTDGQNTRSVKHLKSWICVLFHLLFILALPTTSFFTPIPRSPSGLLHSSTTIFLKALCCTQFCLFLSSSTQHWQLLSVLATLHR